MIKKVFICLLFSLISINAFAAPAACKKGVTNLPNGGYIYKNSAPVRANSSHSAPIIGFRQEPTLIFNIRTSLNGFISIYDRKGKAIGRCPKTSAIGHAGGRYRCTMHTGALRRQALKAGSPEIYFPTVGGKCVRVPDAGRCYGSVKGLCNRTIG